MKLDPGRGLMALLLLGWIVAPGCGDGRPETYPASGEVVYPDGTPLAGATVYFQSVGGETPVEARGFVDQEGKFTLQTYEPNDGAPLGEYRALVSPAVPEEPDSMSIAQFARALNPIDARFKRYDTSGLQFTVSEDSAQNTFRIEVTPPRRR